MPKVDKAALLEAVLTHYEVTPPSGYGDRPIRCPLTSHDDRHASASADMEAGVWFCHACDDGGDAITLVMRNEGVEFKGAKQIVEALSGESDGGLPRAAEPSLLGVRRRARSQRKGGKPVRTWRVR